MVKIHIKDLTLFCLIGIYPEERKKKQKLIFNITINACLKESLDDEITNKMPLDIIEKAKRNFNERFQKINWESYFNDLPFNPSALSLYEWAPIAEDLKVLDRKIVLNSVILKWDVVKKEFKERITF